MRHYGAINIRQVKKILAEKFPDVEFSYSTAGRGRQAGNCVTWTGGPLAFNVRLAIPHSTVKHFNREMTEAEREAWLTEQDAKHTEWLAGEPARRAARKAEGIARAKATRERKAAVYATLRLNWPDVDFKIEINPYGTRFAWTDGPEAERFAMVMSVSVHSCTRVESEEHRRSRIAAERFARRRDRAANRILIVAKAKQRRAIAYSVVESRKAREGAQLALCFA